MYENGIDKLAIIMKTLTVATGHKLLTAMETGHELMVTMEVGHELIVRDVVRCEQLVFISVGCVFEMLVAVDIEKKDQVIYMLMDIDVT